MFDTHLHTEFSTDSKMTIGEAIKASKDNNLGIIVTEHMDLGLKDENKFCFHVPSYFEQYNKYRSDKLLLGIELGMERDLIEEGKEVINSGEFDYVIGSIHLIDKIDLYLDEFYKDKSKGEAFHIYFKNMSYNLAQYDFVDSLGHIDYISRYASYEDPEISYDIFKEDIDEVLKVIVEKEKSMEINTRRLNDKRATTNLVKIYKRFYELGGRTVTLGSDSHNFKDIGNRLSLGKEIADYCNLKIVYYKNRRPEYDK
ncbi:histidinol phosphate phosphatase [Clostridium sporogenes]|uniref:Histidinol-phosphatase n=1 Tax=Clostridium sporogenes TaxID=1509 RepID=A0A7U4JQC8_CLOSG|nr:MULTISPECIES: histidinol phosphate phosphatase [Clostridium]AJD30121.1 histidinol phosphate phosphatase, HisJ family protein [Clostridium botulinum Prevot_594]AVP60274.1 PHP domain-containing protein [Clostridium botulinum]AKC63375.1 putative histidinol-phosphatase HisK [Clostridium sporogenes]AKJ90552.1 histidinol phosphatase [Clostridium sporogenes]EHN14076.1 histidinol-phosphatase [Clostridium sporogenes PA 3679]